MNLREMMNYYQKDGLTRELAAARVCQDIVLKAISIGPLSRNVTIKGGVVMQSLTNDHRRATRDIDLDFIHYSLEDKSIREFLKRLECIDGIKLEILGNIEELRHQDYHGKSIKVRISDSYGAYVESKIDMGVHKHLELEQEEYCFDVCMDEKGASLLKNSKEQSVTEKLRALLIFGPNDKRYKDIYDIYYLMGSLDVEKFKHHIKVLIFDDEGVRENTMEDIVKRVESAFKDKRYLERVASSRQRWLDEDVEAITARILEFLKENM